QQQHLQTSVQSDLFATLDSEVTPSTQVIEKVIEVEVSSPALDLLKQIEVDNLTPRQALEQLYELKAALNS
ncbi:hypothetical protein L1Z39_20790, partial [Acinetobacter baumannii]|nr:hypothetical protein [Acinetobacter baumannii]